VQAERLWALAVCLLLASDAVASPRQVIIDTDPGTDDAIAILLALSSPEVAVRALTVVPGNVTAAQGLDNARRLASLAKRCDLRIAAGATGPLFGALVTGEAWHGKNGLGDVQLPPPACAVDKLWAPDLIIEMIHAAPHEITLVTLGPLTNIALAVKKDPTIVPLVQDVIMMGGSLSGGNITPAAEFNVHVDPEAAQIVFSAGWRLTMVGLDVCRKTLLTRERLQAIAGAHGGVAQFVYGVADFLLRGAEQRGAAGSAMYDPLTVGVAIDPTLVDTSPMRIDVETSGQFTRGETVANRHGTRALAELLPGPDGPRYAYTGKTETVSPNAAVAVDVHADRFLDLLLSRIRAK
jgi:inosine-uridine nucleoside N-ribohydrolase